MAEELLASCGAKAKLMVVPDMAHNQPFRKPHLSYWGPIIEWLGT
jgi:hypothetical protein